MTANFNQERYALHVAGLIEKIKMDAKNSVTIDDAWIDNINSQLVRDQPENEKVWAVISRLALDPEKKPTKVFPMFLLRELSLETEPKEIIPGLLYDQTLATIYAPPASCKSFVAMHMGLTLAYGKPWRGQAVTKCAVLYIAAEGERGVKQRAEAWQQHYGITDDTDQFTLLASAVRLTQHDEVDRLIYQIQQREIELGVKFGLIVIDTLARCIVGQDESKYEVMSVVVDACDRIKTEVGSTVLVVHHTGKDVSKGGRGSSSLAGAVDTELVLTRNTSNNALALEIKKQKYGRDGYTQDYRAVLVTLPTVGRWERTSLVVVPDDGAAEMDDREQDRIKTNADRHSVASVLQPGIYSISGVLDVVRDVKGLNKNKAGYARLRDLFPTGEAYHDTILGRPKRIWRDDRDRFHCVVDKSANGLDKPIDDGVDLGLSSHVTH